MSGTIFIHCQTFSRKSNRGGQSVAQVIAEGTRTGGYHAHVQNPEPPRPIFGNPWAFQKMHDDHVSFRKTRAVTKNHIIQRAIRSDRHTAFTIIASYPIPSVSLDDSREQQDRFKKWVALTLSWVKEQFGDQLKTAFLHLDEAHPHLHFWLLPDNPDADASCMHPGKLAKREAEQRLKAEGVSPREAVKSANRHLKDRMRAWIDDYHRSVGAPCGLRRDGPKRRRLSRAQYLSENTMLTHHHQLDEERGRLEQEIAKLHEARITEAGRVEELEAQADAMHKQRHQLEATAAKYVARAEKHMAQMRGQREQLLAAGPLLDAIVQEIEDRTITFDHVAGWCVSDPEPFRRARFVWSKLNPVIKKLLDMVSTADEQCGEKNRHEPAGPAPRAGRERPSTDTRAGLRPNEAAGLIQMHTETRGKSPFKASFDRLPAPQTTDLDLSGPSL